MIANEYLTLQSVRLNPMEQWIQEGKGLSLLLVKEGSGRYCSVAGVHRIGAGDVLILNGVAKGSLTALEGAKLVFSTFSISLEHMFPLFGSEEISLLQQVGESLGRGRHYRAAELVAGKCQRMLREVPPSFDLDHRSQLLRIVAAILVNEMKVVHEPRVGFIAAQEHMKHVLDSLTASDLITMSVGELAKKFSCSRRHLNRLFHQHFGFSVAGLKLEMRMHKAVSLLRNPNAKIISIAEECGYNHLSLFNLCFKRRFGASPGQWRKDKLIAEQRGAPNRAAQRSLIAFDSSQVEKASLGELLISLSSGNRRGRKASLKILSQATPAKITKVGRLRRAAA